MLEPQDQICSPDNFSSQEKFLIVTRKHLLMWLLSSKQDPRILECPWKNWWWGYWESWFFFFADRGKLALSSPQKLSPVCFCFLVYLFQGREDYRAGSCRAECKEHVGTWIKGVRFMQGELLEIILSFQDLYSGMFILLLLIDRKQQHNFIWIFVSETERLFVPSSIAN